MIVVDLRLISEDRQLIIGCHECAETVSTSIDDIKGYVVMVGEFTSEHLRKCGKEEKPGA